MNRFKKPSILIYVSIILIIAIVAFTVWRVSIHQTKRSLDQTATYHKTLRLKARSFISTNNGKTNPTPYILSAESLASNVVHFIDRNAITGTSPVYTYDQSSEQNFANWKEAKLKAQAYSTAHMAFIEQYLHHWSTTVQTAARFARKELQRSSLGDCSQDDCEGCNLCADCWGPFNTCNDGDCGVCQCCGCTDVLCCPIPPPGYPPGCGVDGIAECLALKGLEEGIVAICASGPTEAALDAICAIAEAVPYAGIPMAAVCAALASNLPDLCGAPASALEKWLANTMGCTCI